MRGGGPIRFGHELDREGLIRADVRGTARVTELVLADVQRLDPQRRKEVVEAYRVLSVNCPFTRAAMLLPFALHKTVQGIGIDNIDGLVQREWASLEQGLTTHVAVLTALGVDLAMPMPGDHLLGIGDALLIDRATLLASPDPIAAAMPLIDGITPVARSIDDTVGQHIQENREKVDAAIGQATLGLHLGGWENALRKIEPFVLFEEDAAKVRRMIEAIQAWGAQGC